MDRIIIDGLSFSLPLFIMAIGGIYCERSGITNLALEGFQGVGAFSGALAAILCANYFATSSQMPFYIAMVFAVLGGSIFSLLHALLCIRFKANQSVSGVVINILAMSLTAFLTKLINKNLFDKASDKFMLEVSKKITVPVLSEIPVLGAVFKEVYPFEFIIVAVAFVAWYVLEKTKFGMDLRACGDNPYAVDAAGISVTFVRVIAIMVSGGLSGLAGISFAYSISANFSSAIYVGYGFLSIAALIFGNWNISTTLASCLLFGFARSGGYALVKALEMPSVYSDLVMTLPYVLTLILLIFFSKFNSPPSALGEVYDKGKR